MRRKRWTEVAIAGGCIVVYTLFAQNGVAMDEVSCGLGVPPGAPGYAAAQVHKEDEVRRNGFLRVCEANLKRFDISLESMDKATHGLAFQPVDLTGTPFVQFENIGGKAEAIKNNNIETKSRLYRGFRLPSGHTLTLFEHDMSADGSKTWRDPKHEPERINGLPARLGVFQAHSGKAISHLSWVEGRRSYELWINANVVGQPLREQLFELAASLPASVPACPNEPPPRAVRLGPDGLPVSEPTPDLLTREQWDSLLHSERPCK